MGAVRLSSQVRPGPVGRKKLGPADRKKLDKAFMEAMDEFLDHGGSKCLAEPKLKRMDALIPTVQDTSQSKKTLKLVYTGCQVAKKESKVSFAESVEKFIEEFWALK